jgi:hypothetical protein
MWIAKIQVNDTSRPPSRNASFPKWLSIENKDHSVFVGLFLAIEITAFPF